MQHKSTHSQKIQHPSEEECFGLLYLLFKESCSLSAIDKGNKRKISKDDKPPIKNFL